MKNKYCFRYCTRCKADRPTAEFATSWHGSTSRTCKKCDALKAAEASRARKESGQCRRCTQSAHGKLYCPTCRHIVDEKLRKMRIKRKLEAVQYKGGRCSDCGLESAFMSVYDFHHLTPSEKSFTLSYYKSWELLKVELDKCVLLCSNCHRIRHEKEDVATAELKHQRAVALDPLPEKQRFVNTKHSAAYTFKLLMEAGRLGGQQNA